MNLSQERRVQIWDGGKSFFASIIQPLSDSIAMMILIGLYQANTFEKTALGALSGCGLLLGLPLFRLISHWKWSASKIISLLLFLSATSLLISITVNHVWWFIFFVSIAILLPITGIPFQSEIYATYHNSKRGKRFLTSLLAGNIGVILFTQISSFLYTDINQTNIIICSFSFFLYIAAFCSFKTPVPFTKRRTPKFLEMFSVLKKDSLFGYICITWFILGAANLWTYPYRTNYLMEPEFGHQLSLQETLLLVVIIPESIRMLTAPLYAYAFDKFNFVVLRMTINLFFAVYCITFFSATSYSGVLIGSMFQGLAMGGGSIAWQLWVTKLAPQGESSTYMSVHSFLTGVRKITFPLLGLWSLHNLGATTCGIISSAFIILATVMLIPVIKSGKTNFKN